MRYFDFHADTLTELTAGSLQKNDKDIDLNRINRICERYVQVFAIWRDVGKVRCREEEFMECYFRARQLLEETDGIELCMDGDEMERALSQGRHAAFLAIEDISFMGAYVKKCRSLGFSFAMPAWNYENEYAYGAAADQTGGLKPLGKETVRELIRQGVVIDVSHLSDAGIEDLLMLTDAPVIASHSNVRDVCAHPRNLRREHILEIIRRGGVIGMNLFAPFVGTGECVELTQLFLHMDEILALGGADALCFGCDWDGCDGVFPKGVTGVESLGAIRAQMSEYGYSEKLLEKIFFENGRRFMHLPPSLQIKALSPK